MKSGVFGTRSTHLLASAWNGNSATADCRRMGPWKQSVTSPHNLIEVTSIPSYLISGERTHCCHKAGFSASETNMETILQKTVELLYHEPNPTKVYSDASPLLRRIPMVHAPGCPRPRTDLMPAHLPDLLCAVSRNLSDYWAPRTCVVS